LGNLKIEISKVGQIALVGDSFSGPSSYREVGKIYLHIMNVGKFPVCSRIVPSVEEYKGSELWYTMSLKTGLYYNPKIQHLKPGAEAAGYFDFKPSPQRRDYVLVLEEQNETQTCEDSGKVTKDPALPKKTVRLAFAPPRPQ
jgi:hypothetical protein